MRLLAHVTGAFCDCRWMIREQIIDSLLISAIVTIDTITASSVTQIRIVTPLLAARTSSENIISLCGCSCILWAKVLEHELVGTLIVCCLFETSTMLDTWMLLKWTLVLPHSVLLTTDYLHLIKVVSIVDTGHHIRPLCLCSVSLLSSLGLQVFLLSDDPSERRSVQIVFASGTSCAISFDRSSHVLCLVEIVRQMLDLSLIHRDLHKVL